MEEYFGRFMLSFVAYITGYCGTVAIALVNRYDLAVKTQNICHVS